MVEELVRRARRRYVINEGLSQASFALAVAIAGLVLLLIAGTRFLQWWTLVVFAAAGMIIGIRRMLRATPSQYAAAVQLDEHAQLHDALSTAIHFSAAPQPAAFVGSQRAQAEEAARTVDVGTAVPFTMPRALYAMAGLGLLASGLLFLRYQISHTLDLRQPLSEVLFEDLAAGKQQQKAGRKADQARERLEAAESLLSKLDRKDQKDQPPEDLESALEQALENPGRPQDGGERNGPQDGKALDSRDKTPEGDPMEGPQNQEQAGDKSGKDGKSGDSKTGKESSSLMDKLKEAMSNMMSKKDGGSQGDKQQNQQQQNGKGDKASGEKSSSQKGMQQEGQSQAGQEENQSEGDAQKGQQAEGQSGAKSNDQASQAGSGIGTQDGAKDLRAAEQLKAMGKLSEILGKRAQTVSGETTIEVESGAQGLRTQYSNQRADHGAAESDVTRDEIPIGLQSYVQQYFEQVHKPAGKADAAKGARPAERKK